jgi:transcriptional regulator with XRE-family HTH domain
MQAESEYGCFIRRDGLMGHTAEKPQHLADKLRQIREAFGLSQNEMVRRLGLTGKLSRARLSEFETGAREPSLLVLLRYAKTAKVPMDFLVDDGVELPVKLRAPSQG